MYFPRYCGFYSISVVFSPKPLSSIVPVQDLRFSIVLSLLFVFCYSLNEKRLRHKKVADVTNTYTRCSGKSDNLSFREAKGGEKSRVVSKAITHREAIKAYHNIRICMRKFDDSGYRRWDRSDYGCLLYIYETEKCRGGARPGPK